MSSNKHVGVWDHDLIEKKLLKPSKKLKKKPYMLINKKLPKLNEKSFKPYKKNKRKKWSFNILHICFIGDEKLLKPS